MKLTIIGGGGFRVPLVYEAAATAGFGVDTVVLYDTSPTRLARIVEVLEGMPQRGHGPRIDVATDLDAALRGADFVFVAIRVGGVAGRVSDERIALSHGILGQETVGAGGLAYAWRTVPVVTALAERIRAVAPSAWVINFTNPAGIVTEAMQAVLADRVIGICDTPIGLVERALATAGAPAGAEVAYDYVGLNHLGWLRALRVDGDDVLPALLASPALPELEEARLMGAEWIRDLGAIPNEYLYYYYRRREALAAIRARPQTRGEFLQAQQTAFFENGDADAWARWARARSERDATYMAEGRPVAETRRAEDVASGGYHLVALRLMAALAGGGEATMILNVRGNGAVPALRRDAVIEIGCRVAGGTITPLPIAPLTTEMLGLAASVKASEELIIEAARTGSDQLATRAFAAHPLIGSATTARELTRAYRAAERDLTETTAPSR